MSGREITASGREVPLSEGRAAGAPVHSPVKPAPWEPYIPVYFWLGGISAGSWLAATAEDVAGENDRALIRAGRYLSLLTLAGGTVLLIADLGRPERFLNMLRIVRPRSAMSLGSWGLTLYGGAAGAAGALQLLEDGFPVRSERLAAWSRGRLGRAIHLAGLPLALFVGGYTGALLASSSTPAWAARRTVLGPLFLASAASTGFAAVAAALEATGRASPGVRRRLARAEAIALAGEAALLAVDRAKATTLPSSAAATRAERLGRGLIVAAGIALPLVMNVARAFAPEPGPPARPRAIRPARFGARRSRAVGGSGPSRPDGGSGRSRPDRGSGRTGPGTGSALSGLVAAGFTLAGGLALRYLITREGYRSAAMPGDTWAYAGGPAKSAGAGDGAGGGGA